jgi:FlaA1/EpsC-like NDP-sugar epimerase
VMVLEMGEQVKIAEVAKALVGLSGRKDIDIVYSGLRPGEKLSEDLFSEYEFRRATSNPLIISVDVSALGIEDVMTAELENDKAAAVWMRQQSTPLVTEPRDLKRRGRHTAQGGPAQWRESLWGTPDQ